MNSSLISEFTSSFKNVRYETTTGYAETHSAKGLVVTPTSIDECRKLLELCKKKNVKICCRGSGLTYGDMILNTNQIIVDVRQLNKILDWDYESGLILVQSGTTFAAVLKKSLLHNWILCSCPGGMDVTIGGAISNNVHGKDAWKNGNFGNHVKSMKLLLASGDIIQVQDRDSSLFRAVVGGMGLLGIILEATLQLKKIPSPFVITRIDLSENIEESIDILNLRKNDSDFSVAWVDSFPQGTSLGRGYISSAKWEDRGKTTSKRDLEESLTKPTRLFRVLPAKPFWYMSRPFFRPSVLQLLNKIHFAFSKFAHNQSSNNSKRLLFTDYNFMHNKIPDIREVYRPHGFLEFEPLLPLAQAKKSIRELLEVCQRNKTQSLLCAMKAHKEDDFLVSYEGQGFSVGIDIQMAGRNINDITTFSKKVYDFTIEEKGKIYLAKDERLDKNNFRKMYSGFQEFAELKQTYDSLERFSSNMYRRLFC